MTEAMRELDRQFRMTSGLNDRRYYKIFYSRLHRFPLLVLGQNPGGETDGTDLVASESFFENWEHDFPCFWNDPNYTLASRMCDLLSQVLATRVHLDRWRYTAVRSIATGCKERAKDFTICP
jgi:hypothetical protein